MIRIAILNKDSFYSKLLAVQLNKLFPGKFKRITAFETKDDVSEHLDKICEYDLVIVGDGISNNYPQLIKILTHTKCIANSKRFHRNQVMLNAGAHWLIPKAVIFDSYSKTGNIMSEWKKPLVDWFFRK